MEVILSQDLFTNELILRLTLGNKTINAFRKKYSIGIRSFFYNLSKIKLQLQTGF
jgi:hypothetical protein